MNEASVRTTSPYSSYPAWQWMEEDYIFARIFAPILRAKILAHFCSKWAQISSNPPLCSAPGQICTHAAENNVLYETVRNNFTKKWKRFSENWNIEVPFTFICKLQTVPSTDSKNMNCVLFIFYYNCIQVLKETSAIRVVNYVRFKPAKDRKCSRIKIVPKRVQTSLSYDGVCILWKRTEAQLISASYIVFANLSLTLEKSPLILRNWWELLNNVLNVNCWQRE